MGSMISFDRVGGGSAQGYLAEARDPRAPGVVVIQEWWGLQGQIKQVCDRLAAEGFNALAPDLYGGKVIGYHDAPAANAEMSSLDFLGATDHAVRGAVQRLRANGSRVGITGFCMGGAVTVIAAVRIPELTAAVTFYGLPPDAAARPEDVRVPLQGHFASDDSWVTPAAADAFEQRLKAAQKSFEIYRYEGHHAFMNSDRKEVYSAAAEKDAWRRCVAFFKTHLK